MLSIHYSSAYRRGPAVRDLHGFPCVRCKTVAGKTCAAHASDRSAKRPAVLPAGSAVSSATASGHHRCPAAATRAPFLHKYTATQPRTWFHMIPCAGCIGKRYESAAVNLRAMHMDSQRALAGRPVLVLDGPCKFKGLSRFLCPAASGFEKLWCYASMTRPLLS